MITEQILNAVVARLKAHANEQYNKGWDVVVECWDTQDFVDYINRAAGLTTLHDEDALYQATLVHIQDYVNLYGEQCSNTRFE